MSHSFVHKISVWFKDGILVRTFRNAAVVLGGRTVTGLLGLAYLAFTARTLGIDEFGVFVLVMAYTGVAGGIIKFRSLSNMIYILNMDTLR